MNPSNTFTKIDFDSSVTILPGGIRGFYLTNRDRDNFFLVGPSDATALPSYDSHGVVMQNGAVRFGTFGVNVPGYNPTVQAGYSMVQPPTTFARPSATPQSGLQIPAAPYTLRPEQHFKDHCLSAPG